MLSPRDFENYLDWVGDNIFPYLMFASVLAIPVLFGVLLFSFGEKEEINLLASEWECAETQTKQVPYTRYDPALKMPITTIITKTVCTVYVRK